MSKQNTNFYEIEIAQLHKTINLLLDERRVPSVLGEVESDEIPIAMKPIETMFQKRTRLENESRIAWNKQVEEAKARMSSDKKSTEQLEKETGVAN